MRLQITTLFFIFTCFTVLNAQVPDTISQGNTAQMMVNTNSGALMVAGYGEMDYNQPISSGKFSNGNLDVHRLVMLFGYKFNKRATFVTELEFEHVKEIYVEQSFINYKINNFMNFRGGLLLIPMGIVNEYHEPTTFFGVERPSLDNVFVPTTWREIGAGISGNIVEASLQYQLYLVNGFLGYDGDKGLLSGQKTFRSGRQKGAESILSSPNLSAKINWYGIRGLKLGLAAYLGNSQSTMYDGLDKSDDFAVAQADSSRVGMHMLGLDAQYRIKGLRLRGQLNYAGVSGTEAYNQFTNSDVGSQMMGFYLEAGYNVLKNTKSSYVLSPFLRYEHYNMHLATDGDLVANDNYNKTELTAGLDFQLTDGIVLKADYQFKKSVANTEWNNQLNLGIGVWFK